MAGNILEELEFNAGDLIKVSEKIRAFDREIYDESTVMPEPGGHGGQWAPPPIFGRSVNPSSTGEGRLTPPITTGTPNVFHLPASLIYGRCAVIFAACTKTSD